jgi:hypothetical protein
MGRRRGHSKSELKWKRKSLTNERGPWILDVSNGMTSRKTTLKRPIVCRSKKDGNCGVVNMDFEIVPLVHLAGAHVTARIRINELKAPMDNTYDLLMAGPYYFALPPGKVVIGALFEAEVIAPMQPGNYTTNLVALNSQGCRVDAQADTLVL